MKPKIGDTIYYLCDNQVLQYDVGYVGAESFIIDLYEYCVDFEFYYKDFNIVWFKSLNKALKALRKNYGRRKTISHIFPNMWEIEEEEL